MSDAVRPMALSPNERFLYAQVSFFHGFVEYDFKTDKVTRVVDLPIAEAIKDLPKEDYLLDSAHHGIALDPTGKRFCVAGTMSDYAAIVSRRKPSQLQDPRRSARSPTGRPTAPTASTATSRSAAPTGSR